MSKLNPATSTFITDGGVYDACVDLVFVFMMCFYLIVVFMMFESVLCNCNVYEQVFRSRDSHQLAYA